MSEKKLAEVYRSEATLSRVYIKAASYWGLTLGDLRKAVEAADGIADEAEVQLAELRQHYSKKDTWVAKSASIVSEVRA